MPLLPGMLLGPYKVEAPLGKGGMGEVYRAKDARLGRDVAIKVLPANLNDPAASLARFDREARVLAALSHPNILSIFDVGTEGGVSFVVMELLRGQTLRSRIADHRLPWRQAVQIGIEIAEGLSAAHSKGIIHRDLKPENIFLTPDDHIKILDFGLASWQQRLESVDASDTTTGPATAPGTVVGTTPYMSPEQLRGIQLDTRTDIFSLGCVLQEVITGSRPFSGATQAETTAAILKDEPQSLSEFNSSVPPELDRVIKRCLSKDPNHRFQSAGDLAFHLHQILNIAPSRKVPSDSSRDRVRFRLGVAAAFLVIVAGIYFVLRPTAAHAEKTRLFVRPFANSSGNSQQDEFIAGLTDETITELGKIDPAHLGVIAPTSSKLLAAKPIDELGRQLNVQFVLEGSVSRSGERVRINAQLISVSDQTQFWSQSYGDDLRDILRVENDVATSVAKEIRSRIPAVSTDLPKVATTRQIDPAAYDAYLKGRLCWAGRDLLGSVAAYQQALLKEPDYPLARAALASAYLLLGQVPNDVMPPNDAMPKARDAANRALAADPSNSEAHCVLANIAASYDWDFAASEREYQLAMRLDPNNSTAHEWYGHYLIMRNRLSEALAETNRALDLDPVSPVFNSARAETFFYARDFDSSISQARHTVEQYPKSLYARFWLASAYRQKQMYPQAIHEFDQLRTLVPNNPAMLMAYGHALAVSGNRDAARQVLTQLSSLGKTRYVPAVYFAVLHVGLGENDTAFQWFDRALSERNDRLFYLAVDPIADPVRSDPRFANLLSRLHLQ